MKPEKCPVCKGKGKVTIPAFNVLAGNIRGKTTLKQCHGCDGKGWVAVPDKEAK